MQGILVPGWERACQVQKLGPLLHTGSQPCSQKPRSQEAPILGCSGNVLGPAGVWGGLVCKEPHWPPRPDIWSLDGPGLEELPPSEPSEGPGEGVI